MTWQSYLDYFEKILIAAIPEPPYNDEDFAHYTKMNYSRQNRWVKLGKLTRETIEAIREVNTQQHWIVITEPWCGDAAHLVPFIEMMSAENPLISFEVQLRDKDSEIDKYLTGTSKSIPILVVRNEAGEDLFHWGPRPKECQALYIKLKEEMADLETLKIALQHWYNADKGSSVQQEVIELLAENITV